MLLFVSGSYPAIPDGIAASANILLDSMVKIKPECKIGLLTTNLPEIKKYLKDNKNVSVKYLDNWKLGFKSIKKYISILKNNPITAVHLEYPGVGYGKTLFASFLPLLTKFYNIGKKEKIAFYVRLHEFTCARLSRKIAIIPILLFADAIYVPSFKDRKAAKKLAGKKVKKTVIGTNIRVYKTEKKKTDKKVISYFGSVYPGKGIEHMLNIWKQIKDRDIEEQFVFKIIGEVNPENNNHFAGYHKRVIDWLKQYHMLEFVEITGYITDEEVSKEIQNSHVATLLYEDGLTLRRGSFLACLVHGIPIVTSLGDKEANKLLKGHNGIFMSENDSEIINKVFAFAAMDDVEINKIKWDNQKLSTYFDWNEIAKTFLRDYGFWV